MPRFLTTLPLIAALMTAPAAFAQEDTTAPADDTATSEATTSDTAGDDTATGETDPAADLSLGEENQPAIPQPYIKEAFDDWQLQCFPVEGEDDPCQMYQLLKDEQGTEVAEVQIFRLPSGSKAVAGATVTVPLETLLTAQLTIAVDGGKGKRYPFVFCSPVGCYARIGFTADDIAAFKRGAKAVVTLRPAPAPDQTVSLPMSLKGFTNAFNASSVIKN